MNLVGRFRISNKLLILAPFFAGLIGLWWAIPADAKVQVREMQQAAAKLLDAAEKCRPHKFKTYLPEVKALLNAGRFDAAIALMKVDASDDPMGQLVLAIKSYAWSMARAGRAAEVDAELTFFKDNGRVKEWLSNHEDKELKEIYRAYLLTGSALAEADRGDLESALKKGGVKNVLRHLFNEGKDDSAIEAAKIFSEGDVEKIRPLARKFSGASKEFNLAMVEQFPTLAFDIVEACNGDFEGSTKLRWETFREIAKVVSPEMRRSIEIEALAGDYLPGEYQNRIVADFLKQPAVGDSESDTPTVRVFDHLLRTNKLLDARRLFESVDAEQAFSLSGLELAERLFDAGDRQAAANTLDRVIEVTKAEEYPIFAVGAFAWGRALKIGEIDSAAELQKLSSTCDPRIVNMHRQVHKAGFSKMKSVVDPIKLCWDSLVDPADQEHLDESERSLRKSLLWEYLVAELAIRNDSQQAYDATRALPRSIVGNPVAIGPVIKVLLARGHDEKAIAYAKCWQDSPAGSFWLGDSFFHNFDSTEIVYEPKPETERKIFEAIGDKLEDRLFLTYRLTKALERRDKQAALGLVARILTKNRYVQTEAAEFTKLNWHEDFIALVKKIADPDDADLIVGEVALALFESRRIDELILHLEKHVPLFRHDRPVRFHKLIGFALGTEYLFGCQRGY